MTQILMPKATAVWLIDNTSLSFDQIGVFCSLHPLEVQAIADGEAGVGIQGYDPVLNGQITRSELDRCEADKTAVLVLATSHLPTPNRRTKGPRYVPVARRGDKPDAIMWLVKHHSELKKRSQKFVIGRTGILLTLQRNIRLCWDFAVRMISMQQLKKLVVQPRPKNRFQTCQNCPRAPRQSHDAKERYVDEDNDDKVQTQDQIMQQIAIMESEHGDLDAVIERLGEDLPFDQLKLQRLKKRKLILKDEMTKLRSRILPDIIA